LWFVLRYFGLTGIQQRLRRHMELAQTLAQWIDAAPEWKRVAPVPFSTVVFRHAASSLTEEAQDRLNETILQRVNASGEVFLSHTRLHGRICLRLAIGNLRTEEQHVRRAWELLTAAANEVGVSG
ncbi:MAG: amino acid decarboxylase, partial [Gemmatimonadetes bacterium]|nr:amino acid decarboxylase [Gemmatimonadota bacterium]